MWEDKFLSNKERKFYKDVFGQIEGAEFIEILKLKFNPIVKSYGFSGNKNHFYKKNSPFIYTIQIFKDKYGGNCALNVGVHLLKIETGRIELPSIPSKYNIYDCLISKNIPMNNNNSWYYYGKTTEEGIETVSIMIEMLKEKGIPFLDQFTKYPHPFDKISLKDLEYPTEKYGKYGLSKEKLNKSYTLVFLAHFNLDFGNKDKGFKILNLVWQKECERFKNFADSPYYLKIKQLRENYR